MQDVTNFADLVRRAAASHGARPALRSHATLITWSELDQQVDAVAAHLAALDLPDDDHGPARIAVALPNVPEFAAVFFGVLRAGLVAVPVNPAYTARELAHVFADSGAAVVVGTQSVVSAVGAGGPPAPVHPRRQPRRSSCRTQPARAPPPAATDLAILLYTSGTAGAPKGAMLSHRALLANHEQLAAIEPPPVRPDDVLLLAAAALPRVRAQQRPRRGRLPRGLRRARRALRPGGLPRGHRAARRHRHRRRPAHVHRLVADGGAAHPAWAGSASPSAARPRWTPPPNAGSSRRPVSRCTRGTG